ncbi:MAG: hypothetical protein R2800_04330 [Flavipsychrobacter sp.]
MKLFKQLSKVTFILVFMLLAMPKTSNATWGWGGSSCGCGYHSHTWYCWYYGCNHNCGGNDVPLDGGLSLLAVAGAGLGIKKAVAKRKSKKNTDK